MDRFPSKQYIRMVLFRGMMFAASTFTGSYGEGYGDGYGEGQPPHSDGLPMVFSGELADVQKAGIQCAVAPDSTSNWEPALTINLDHDKSDFLLNTYNQFSKNYFEYSWPSTAQLIMLGVQMFQRGVKRLKVQLLPDKAGLKTDLSIYLNYQSGEHLHWQIHLPGLNMQVANGADNLSQAVALLTPLFLQLVSLAWFNAENETPASSDLKCGKGLSDQCEYTQSLYWKSTDSVQCRLQAHDYSLYESKVGYFCYFVPSENNLLFIKKAFIDQAIQNYTDQLDRTKGNLDSVKDASLSIQANYEYCDPLIPLASYCKSVTTASGLTYYPVSYAEVALIDKTAGVVKFINENSLDETECAHIDKKPGGIPAVPSISAVPVPDAAQALPIQSGSPRSIGPVKSPLSEIYPKKNMGGQVTPANAIWFMKLHGKENQSGGEGGGTARKQLVQEFLNLKTHKSMQDRYRYLFALAKKYDAESTAFCVSDNSGDPLLEPIVEEVAVSEGARPSRRKVAKVRWNKLSCYANRDLKKDESFQVDAVEVPGEDKASKTLASYLTRFSNQRGKHFLLKGRLIYIQQASGRNDTNAVFDQNIEQVSEGGEQLWRTTLRISQDIPIGAPLKMKY